MPYVYFLPDTLKIMLEAYNPFFLQNKRPKAIVILVELFKNILEIDLYCCLKNSKNKKKHEVENAASILGSVSSSNE